METQWVWDDIAYEAVCVAVTEDIKAGIAEFVKLTGKSEEEIRLLVVRTAYFHYRYGILENYVSE